MHKVMPLQKIETHIAQKDVPLSSLNVATYNTIHIHTKLSYRCDI
jgi:hypothetical protein